MMKLIKLEFAKYRFTPYLLAAFFIFLFGIIFCFLIRIIPVLEQQMGMPELANEMKLLNEWNYFIALIATLFMAAYGILSAVMHTKITIEEYNGKKACLLFSYPLSRSGILFVKSGLVFFLTVLFTFVSTVAAILLFAVCAAILRLMPEAFSGAIFLELLTTSGVFAMLAASIGLVSMRVSFFKKSMVAPVVTSFLLVIPFSNTLSFFPEQSGIIRVTGMVILLLAGICLMARLFVRVDKMEAI